MEYDRGSDQRVNPIFNQIHSLQTQVIYCDILVTSILPCKSGLQGINLCLQEGTLVFHNNLLSVEKTDSHRKGIFHNQFPKSRNFWTSGRGGAAGSRGS